MRRINIVLFPKNPMRNSEREVSKTHHDIALMVLKEQAKMSPKVQPICLPKPDANYAGLDAVATGWGVFAANSIEQSPVLRKVTLKVSKKNYYRHYFFGTEVNKNGKGDWMDPCGGDSG